MERGGTPRMACLFLLLVLWQGRTAVGQINDGAVILWRDGGSSVYYTSGIVEVHYTGLIGNICHGGTWEQAEADVVCRQLGYSGASGYGVAGDGARFGVDESSTLINQVDCLSDEVSIWQCKFPFGGIVDLNCPDQNDVFVECFSTRLWDSAVYQGMVRLQEGFYVTSGRVEVYCNDRWGSICASAFDQPVADTVCVQLGYQGALEYNYLYLPSSSDTPQWYSEFNCSRAQSCISSCGVCPAEATIPCSANQATVKCFFNEFSNLPSQSCQFEEECEDCSTNLATILGSVGGSIAVVTLFVIVPLTIWCCVACHPHTHEQEITKTKSTSLTESSEADAVTRSASQKAVRVDTGSHVGITLSPPPYESTFQGFFKQQPSNQALATPPPAYYQ